MKVKNLKVHPSLASVWLLNEEKIDFNQPNCRQAHHMTRTRRKLHPPQKKKTLFSKWF